MTAQEAVEYYKRQAQEMTDNELAYAEQDASEAAKQARGMGHSSAKYATAAFAYHYEAEIRQLCN